MTYLFVFLWRNRMVCFGSGCLAERRTGLGKQPRQACRHSEMPLLATWAESLAFRSVLHTLPCQVPTGTLAAGTTQGPEQAVAASIQGTGWDGVYGVSGQLSLGAGDIPLAEVLCTRALCSVWVFLHQADGLPGVGAWGRNSQKTEGSSRASKWEVMGWPH